MKDLSGPSHKSPDFHLSQSIGSLRYQLVIDISVNTTAGPWLGRLRSQQEARSAVTDVGKTDNPGLCVSGGEVKVGSRARLMLAQFPLEPESTPYRFQGTDTCF